MSFIVGGAIVDGAITTSKIANGAVTNPKIADGAINLNKLGTNAHPFVQDYSGSAISSQSIVVINAKYGLSFHTNNFTGLLAYTDYNLAFGTTPSTIGNWKNPMNATDGDWNTWATINSPTANDEIRVDLGDIATRTIAARVSISASNAAIFEYSTNGTTWGGAYYTRNPENLFFKDVSCRYLRIRIINTPGTGLAVSQIAAWPPAYRLVPTTDLNNVSFYPAMPGFSTNYTMLTTTASGSYAKLYPIETQE